MSALAPVLSLTQKPILKRCEERELFEKRDRLQVVVDELQKQNLLSQSSGDDEIGALKMQIDSVRNQIVEANQRLLFSVARRFANPVLSLDELVSMGELPLMRSVELFDVSRGYCFSTYATNALRNFFSRQIQREARRQKETLPLIEQREQGVLSGEFDNQQAERYYYVARLLKYLSSRDKTILEARFGLGDFDQPHTFRQIAGMVGLSKERVRVLAHRSIGYLSEHVSCFDVTLV